MPISLQKLRNDAVKATEIELHWDKLEDETYRKDFEQALQLVDAGIPGLEYIYQKLSTDDMQDSMEGIEHSQEELVEACADELYEAYQLQEVYRRYKRITEIIDLH